MSKLLKEYSLRPTSWDYTYKNIKNYEGSSPENKTPV